MQLQPSIEENEAITGQVGSTRTPHPDWIVPVSVLALLVILLLLLIVVYRRSKARFRSYDYAHMRMRGSGGGGMDAVELRDHFDNGRGGNGSIGEEEFDEDLEDEIAVPSAVSQQPPPPNISIAKPAAVVGVARTTNAGIGSDNV